MLKSRSYIRALVLHSSFSHPPHLLTTSKFLHSCLSPLLIALGTIYQPDCLRVKVGVGNAFHTAESSYVKKSSLCLSWNCFWRKSRLRFRKQVKMDCFVNLRVLLFIVFAFGLVKKLSLLKVIPRRNWRHFLFARSLIRFFHLICQS